MKMNIPITKTIFGDEEKEAIVKPLETGWVVQGPNVAKFQNMFADFTGSKYAHAASNCTTALHLGLEAMDITKGDKVIVPSFTYVASANAVEYTGAEVVFCDIDLKTFNIDETKLEEIIKKDSSIKAIMPVNLFGLCANMPYIMELAKKYNLKVIEDSACGLEINTLFILENLFVLVKVECLSRILQIKYLNLKIMELANLIFKDIKKREVLYFLILQ